MSTSPFPWARPDPVALAPDERIVWQAGPSTRALALRLYRIRLVALYGGVLTVADMVQARLHGVGAIETAIPGLLTTLAALAIFAALAYGSARTTRYTITDRRAVMQCGLALSATIGMPLHRIAAVSVRVHRDGTGDITLQPHTGSNLAFFKLWPFARPWRLARPEPMFRDVPDAGSVATMLSRRVAAAQRGPTAATAIPHPEPLAA